MLKVRCLQISETIWCNNIHLGFCSVQESCKKKRLWKSCRQIWPRINFTPIIICVFFLLFVFLYSWKTLFRKIWPRINFTPITICVFLLFLCFPIICVFLYFLYFFIFGKCFFGKSDGHCFNFASITLCFLGNQMFRQIKWIFSKESKITSLHKNHIL